MDTTPLSEYMDVVISEDRLSAIIQFNQKEFQCTADELEEFLRQNGIKFGINKEVLALIAKEKDKSIYNRVTVANGIAPKDGEDGFIKYLFNLEEEKKPIVQEDGRVDFREVLSLNNVRKGQLIAERFPATDGKDGMTVTGQTIPGKKGKDTHFKIGKNVVADEKKMRLYATIDGLVALTENDRINVFPVYEVNGDVDYNIGNIDFVGTVVVRGNVLSGFRIKASGDIRVIGGVEGAELYADGSIEITSGILGGNKGLVKAKKNVKCSFIQDANVEAGEDIIVNQSILHSRIRAGRNVICQGSKGLIVGGVIQAGQQVTARVIGNSTSTPTTIEVGVRPDLRNELSELRAKVKELTENADKTDKALTLLDQMANAGQLTPDRMAMRIRLSSTKRQTAEELGRLRERMLEIEKSLEDASHSKVEVIHTIHPGSKIVIGRYTRFIKDPVKHVTFRLTDGEVGMISN